MAQLGSFSAPFGLGWVIRWVVFSLWLCWLGMMVKEGFIHISDVSDQPQSLHKVCYHLVV